MSMTNNRLVNGEYKTKLSKAFTCTWEMRIQCSTQSRSQNDVNEWRSRKLRMANQKATKTSTTWAASHLIKWNKNTSDSRKNGIKVATTELNSSESWWKIDQWISVDRHDCASFTQKKLIHFKQLNICFCESKILIVLLFACLNLSQIDLTSAKFKKKNGTNAKAMKEKQIENFSFDYFLSSSVTFDSALRFVSIYFTSFHLSVISFI